MNDDNGLHEPPRREQTQRMDSTLTSQRQKPGVVALHVSAAWHRLVGRAYSVTDIKKRQAIHGRKNAHIEAEWTTPEHWSHNNYERSHLPQLCIRASGWKARLIALFLWPKKPWSM